MRLFCLLIVALSVAIAAYSPARAQTSKAATAPTAAAAQPQDADWPQFRGPGTRGVAANPNLPDRWSLSENISWKTDIAGRAWSSPIVWGNRAFVTTVVYSGKPDPAKKGFYLNSASPEEMKAEHQWKVVCLDLLTGKPLWEQVVFKGLPPADTHGKNSFASETPVTDGRLVYACFGNVGIFALDMEGHEVWRYLIPSREMRSGWGTAASPTLYGDRLYYVNDNEEKSYIVALDKTKGTEIWRTDRDEKSNWSTPYVWKNSQRTEIVTAGTGAVRSYDLEGKLLWWLKGMSGITIAAPYAEGDLLYVTSGYIIDKQKPIYAIRPGGGGDISLTADQTANQFIAWSNPTAAPYNPSTLLYDGRLYVLGDRGTMSAFNPKTGDTIYQNEKLPGSAAFTSSPWAYNGQVFCINEDGTTFVLRAGDKFELLRTNKLADDDTCLATPAAAGDRLLIRTESRVYCIRKNPTNNTDGKISINTVSKDVKAVRQQ
jgi:outer membrane protein assembly factor BamB